MFPIFILMIATVMQLGSFVEPTTIAPSDLTTAVSDNPIDDKNDPTGGWIETTLPESRNWSRPFLTCPGGMLMRSFIVGSPNLIARLQQESSPQSPSSSNSVTLIITAVRIQCHGEPGQGKSGPELWIGNYAHHLNEDYLECLNGGFTGYALQTPFPKANSSVKKLTSEAINVKMKCSSEDEKEVIGYPTNQGDWTPYANCRADHGICGLKVISQPIKRLAQIQNVGVKCCPDILNIIGGRGAGPSGPSQKLFGPLTTLLYLGLIFA